MKCTCDKWQPNIAKIYGAAFISGTNGFPCLVPEFKFCPWCGTELTYELHMHEYADTIFVDRRDFFNKPTVVEACVKCGIRKDAEVEKETT